MTPLVLAAILTSRQAPALVTYLEPAAPLSRAIPALSALLRLPLDVAKTLKSDVVCIDVHDVTPEELLKKLAWATCAEWETKADGTRLLVPSDKARKIQASEELQRRAGLITQYLNSSQRMFQTLDAKPILKTLDPLALASIPEDGRLVFSTRPNRLQVAFPTDVSQLVFDAVANAPVATIANPNGTGTPLGRPDARKIDKAVLPVSIMYIHDDLLVSGSLLLYDRDGNDIIGPGFNTFSITTAPDKATDRSKHVSFSPESLRFAKFLAGETAGVNVMELFHFRTPPQNVSTVTEADRKDILARLFDPEHFEPLAYPSDLLRSLAHVTREQIVACLPDSFIGTFPLVFTGSSTVKKLRNALIANRDIDMRSVDGWLTARPRDPNEAEAVRLDRHKLAEVVNMLHGRDYMRFEDEVRLAQSGYGEHPSSLIDFWSVLARPTYFAQSTNTDWEMLRLFVSLSQPQQELLKNGQPLSLGLLEGEQAALVNRIIFGAEGAMHSGIMLNAYPPEPTEVVPNQFLTLTAEVHEAPIVMAANAPAEQRRRMLGVEPVAETQVIYFGAGYLASEATNQTAGGNRGFFSLPPDQLRTGTGKTIALRLIVSKQLIRGGIFEDDVMSPEVTTSFANLRTKYQQMFDQIFKAASQRGPVQGGINRPAKP